ATSWRKLTSDQQTIFREESAAAGTLMRKLIGDDEADQVKKLEAAGLAVTRPDLAPFRAKMEPAYKRIAAYAGEANGKKVQGLGEQPAKAVAVGVAWRPAGLAVEVVGGPACLAGAALARIGAAGESCQPATDRRWQSDAASSAMTLFLRARHTAVWAE